MTTTDPYARFRTTLEEMIAEIEWTPTAANAFNVAAYAERFQRQPSYEELELTIARALYHARAFEKTPDSVDPVSGLRFADIAKGARLVARETAALLAAMPMDDHDHIESKSMVADVYALDPKEEAPFVPEILFAAIDAQAERWKEASEEAYQLRVADAQAKGLPIPEPDHRLPEMPERTVEEHIAALDRGREWADNLIGLAQAAGIEPQPRPAKVSH